MRLVVVSCDGCSVMIMDMVMIVVGTGLVLGMLLV